MELKDRVALITGGARIGQDVAEALAARGCHVALTYRRSRERAEEGAAKVRARGARCELIAADLTKKADLEAVVPEVRRRFGRLDVLVNMASVYYQSPLALLESNTFDGGLAGEAPYRESLDVEALSAYWLSLRAAPFMREKGAGRIVNFSDWLPVSSRPRYKSMLPYYVAKGTVKALTEALALELAPDILVNAVAPGPALPPDDMSEAERRTVAEQTPLKDWGGGAEMAKAVLFFIDSEFVTGETVRVDGGRHLF